MHRESEKLLNGSLQNKTISLIRPFFFFIAEDQWHYKRRVTISKTIVTQAKLKNMFACPSPSHHFFY
jgi:hypothetical protein